MFHQIFSSSYAQRRYECGPLYEQRTRFLAHCIRAGHSHDQLQEIAAYQLIVIEKLNLREKGRVEPHDIHSAARRWIQRKNNHPRLTDRSRGRTRFVSIATRWLGFLGRLEKPAALAKPYADALEQWVEHMHSERGLAPLTIATEVWHVTKFLHYLQARGTPLIQLSIKDIDKAIESRGNGRSYARRTTRLHVSAVRAFLRFAENCRICSKGLADAVAAPTVYRQEFLPTGPSWQEVQRLIRSAQGNEPKAIRDRAILILLSVYGLRAGELLRLRLQDFDWDTNKIQVRHGKGKGRATMALDGLSERGCRSIY